MNDLVIQARNQIMALEESMKTIPHLTAEDLNANCTHVFAPGAVARTMTIPAGMMIVGKIHKHAHLNILSKGTVMVHTESEGLRTLEGPLTMCSAAGTKRALIALTDAVWTTIHLTNETDLDKIEEEVIAPSFEAYEAFKQIEWKAS